MDSVLIGLLTLAVIILWPLCHLYARAWEREKKINELLLKRLDEHTHQTRWVQEQLHNDLCEGHGHGK